MQSGGPSQPICANLVEKCVGVLLWSGNFVTYGYTDGKVTSVTLNGSTTILNNVLYQPFGPISGWSWGNGTFAVREYDLDGKITDLDSAGLKTYSYDDAFRITGITDVTEPSFSQTFGHDLLDRLTSATGTSLNQSWTYDANGNRLTQGGSDPSTYTILSTSNRINSISGSLTRTYSYDASGNITSDGTATHTYDDAGRMVSATKSGVTATYSINALGQRVKKTVAGTSTYFAYDEAGHLIGEYDSSGNLIQETIWFENIPVAVLKPNSSSVDLFYLHTDHLNTPRRISRPSDNAVVWRWDSDPFGTSAVNEDPDGDATPFSYNLRFPGQYYDSETGLHYNYYRDYDPQTGRYLQSDPLLQPNRFLTAEWAFFVPALLRAPAWMHPYSYVTSQPLFEVDELGLGPIRALKCWWKYRKLDQYAEQCRTECGDDIMKQLQFMQKYESVSLSAAQLKCVCTRAAAVGDGNLCATWAKECTGAASPSWY